MCRRRFGLYYYSSKMESPTLNTAHLVLRPFTAEQVIALIEAPESFESVSGLPAAVGLRDFFVSDDVDPAWIARLQSVGAPKPWSLGFAVIDKNSQSIVGSGGFKGPADEDGIVEIAYGIVSAFEGRGYATEVAKALTTYCFENGVRRVRAHTLPVTNASNHILTKCGFHFVGEVVDPHDGLIWRWERNSTSDGLT
jgi:[ribosomal protein S5]-alanine N-acetyltransferase